MAVFATVGFGDIAPVIQAARALALGQMEANLVLLGLLLRLVTAPIAAPGQRDGEDEAEQHCPEHAAERPGAHQV